MSLNTQRRTILLFAVLALYIVLQFIWWGVLLLRRDAEIVRLALELHALGGADPGTMDTTRSLRMVLGEGAVFLALLLTVLFLTLRAIRRDLRLARSQRNFLLAVSHELRTPIAAIKLQLQTLGRNRLTEEQRNELRGQAIVEADRLADLTDKVLIATRAEEGALTLSHEPVELMALFHSIMERARTQLAPRHTLLMRGPELVEVRTDPQALRSIADNLLENAAKYAPEGSTITLEVRVGRDGWRLSVEDEGPGIPAGEEQRIFEKFHRIGNEETRQAKGTGLGLYIVDRLVRSMGGSIQVRTRDPRGAIFVASFPNR